jgi:glycerol uptake facilitator-like aquaporin
MKYLKIANIIMNFLPFIFGACLYSFYYWSRSFVTEHEGQVSAGISTLRKITQPVMVITFYSILPNLVLMITLFWVAIKRKEKIRVNLLFYLLGIVIMFYVTFFDPIDVLSWYLD